jgi:nitrate/nitrite transport system substrate-binding protein
MPYLITTGKVTKNNVRVPMYILARLNTNGQCISVAKRYLDLKVGTDASALEAGVRRALGRRQAGQGRGDVPGRHARPVDALLARRGGIDPDKDVSTIVVRRRRWWRT